MSDTPAMTFGQFIKMKREQLGYSIPEAAEHCKVFEASLRKWESDDHRPFMPSWVKLMNTYGLTANELAQYGMKHKKWKTLPPTSRVKAAIRYASADILKSMTGQSAFERNLRDKVLTVLSECDSLLEPLAFIDEAF